MPGTGERAKKRKRRHDDRQRADLIPAGKVSDRECGKKNAGTRENYIRGTMGEERGGGSRGEADIYNKHG